MPFTVPSAMLDKDCACSEHKGQIGYDVIRTNRVWSGAVIGIGIAFARCVWARAYRALPQKGLNIKAIPTSEIKVDPDRRHYAEWQSGRCIPATVMVRVICTPAKGRSVSGQTFRARPVAKTFFSGAMTQ